MKRSRFSEEQIIGILKEHEAGVSVADAVGAVPIALFADRARIDGLCGGPPLRHFVG
jgi:putative transposase